MIKKCCDCGTQIFGWTARRCNRCSGKKKIIPPQDRFWLHIKKTDTCWFWEGGKTTAGYGTLSNSGSKTGFPILAHRLSYEIHNGIIPEGKLVMHSCDKPSCVNPLHLSIGTNAENIKDAKMKGRFPKGSSHWNAKLKEKDVIKIRSLNGIISHKDIGMLFKVTRSTVYDIIKNKKWTHVT